MNSKDSVCNRTLFCCTVFLLTVIPLAAHAVLQTTIVDGKYDEWDLNRDCFPPLHHKSNGRSGKILPNVYFRYDRSTNTIFVLVLNKDDALKSQNKPATSIYSPDQNALLGNGTGNESIISDFSWIMDGKSRIGWEGSFQINSKNYDLGDDFHLHHNLVKRDSRGDRKTAAEVKVLDTDGLFNDCE
ncbi:MAG: hypothetical protein D3924_15595 [Candidatus Electrothrix sp. AR4]|nr:hypothetical protein [Candidatus Electrothrix sp. AR4]